MPIQRLFNIAALSVLPFWVLIIFAPYWNMTNRLMQSLWIVGIPIAIYYIIALPRLKSLLSLFFRKDLYKLYLAAMGSPGSAVMMWAHVSAFDLFVGRYIYFDALDRSFSWFFIGPLLFVTMLLGPLGLGAYMLAVVAFTL